MKSDKERFIVPNELQVYRLRFKEGPPLAYLVHQKNSSQFYLDREQALKAIKWPKGTPTGDGLREWFAQFTDLDEAFMQKHQIRLGKGESPHQDAMDYEPGTFSVLKDGTSDESQPETPTETAEILPFECTAVDFEEEENPCENTKMVV